MFSDEYFRYSLLTQRQNSLWNLDKRTVILICALMLPVCVFCATYMTLFGIYEKMVYPNGLRLKVSQLNVHRALTYNAFSIEENIASDITFRKERQIDITNRKLVCYYNFPSDAQSMQVKDLDSSLCTHINAAFAEVVNDSIYLDQNNQNTLKNLVALKTTNKDLKILLSIGGAGATSGYSDMVFNHTNRKSFIKSVLYYVKTFGIDGVDLDWEFPNEQPDGDKRQRIHFTQLLEELRQTINRQEKYKFLLSLAVAAPTNIIDNSYDVTYINEFVDYINLMTYDFHYYTKFTPFTGFNSPLYASGNEKYYLSMLNINYSTNYWSYLGMDHGKIVVGLPTYGHTFRLVNSRNNGLYAPAMGFGKLGTLGFADYAQICTFLLANQISPMFDMDTKSPYASKYLEWISFDNVESLTYKAEYVRDNGFGGAMIYSLNNDDWRGVCNVPEGNSVKFPLTKVVGKVLVGNDEDA